MKDCSVNLTSSVTTFDTPWHSKPVTSTQQNTEWGSATSSIWVKEPNNKIPSSWGLNTSQAISTGTAMVDSERNLNNEQNTEDRVASFIMVDNTETSVPSTSNISVSKEQLQGKKLKIAVSRL